MEMPDHELRTLLARLEERQKMHTEKLEAIDREIAGLKGQLWKLFIVAAGAAAGGSGIAKMVLTGGI